MSTLIPEATLKSIRQELNGPETATITMANDDNALVLTGSNNNVSIEWFGNQVFYGTITGASHTTEILDPIAYNKVYAGLVGPLFSGTYNGTDADIVLADILDAMHLNVGECPDTDVYLIFEYAKRFDSATFLAKLLRKDFWTTGGDTFHIGSRGGCQLFLNFNEGTGEAAHDTTCMFNNFTMGDSPNAPTWVTVGKHGGCLSFDGSDYLSKSSKVINTTSDFSIATYVYLDSIAGTQVVYHRNGAFRLRIVAGEVDFRVDHSGNDCIYTTNNANLSTGVWYRITAVYYSKYHSVAIYVDGVEKSYGTTQLGTGSASNTDTDVYIGRSHIAADGFFGDLDDLMVYNKALVLEEVEALYNLDYISIPKSVTDRSKQKNHVIVTGATSAKAKIVGEAYVDPDTGVIVEGNPEEDGFEDFDYKSDRKKEDRASTKAELDRLAAKYLEDLQLETSSVAIDVDINIGWPLEPGSYVVVDKERLALSGTYRVRARTIELGTIRLEINRGEMLLENYLEELADYSSKGIFVISDDLLSEASQGWGTNLLFEAYDPPGVNSKRNSVRWGGAPTGYPESGSLYFSGGDTYPISSGTLVVNTTGVTYLYFDLGCATPSVLQSTTSESTTVGGQKGVVAVLTVSGNSDQEIGIHPYNSIGLKINEELLADQAVSPDKAVRGMLPYTVSITFSHVTGDEYDSVQWSSGTINFADGTTQSISAGSALNMSESAWHYIYFVEGSSTLVDTTDYSLCNTRSRGLIASLWVAAAIDEQRVTIIPFKGKEHALAADMLTVGSVISEKITSRSIYGKDIATDEGVGTTSPGVRIVGIGSDVETLGTFPPGILGYGYKPSLGMLVRTFYLDNSTGVMYVYRDGNFKVFKDDSTEIGSLDGSAASFTGWSGNTLGLTVGMNDGIMLNAGGSAIYITRTATYLNDSVNVIRPITTNRAVDLGTSTYKFGDIWGDVHYADLHMSDNVCPKCGREFKENDKLELTVTGFRTYEDSDLREIICVPVHRWCNPIYRMIRILRRILGRE